MLALLAALALGFSQVQAGPPALERYDLPDGRNVAHVVLNEAVQALALPPGAQVPVAVRFFGSSTYFVDDNTGRVDWPHVGDLDGVIYIDAAAYRKAVLSAAPGLGSAELDRRQQRLPFEVRHRVRAKLEEIASELGGRPGALEDANLEVPFEGFGALRRDAGPYEGYYPGEPHFGNSAGMERLRAAAAALGPRAPESALANRYTDVHSELSMDFRLRPGWLSGDPVKAVKRLLQLAVWRGDDAAAMRLKELAGKSEQELLAGYDGLVEIVRAELERAKPSPEALERVRGAAAGAAASGENLVTLDPR